MRLRKGDVFISAIRTDEENSDASTSAVGRDPDVPTVHLCKFNPDIPNTSSEVEVASVQFAHHHGEDKSLPIALCNDLRTDCLVAGKICCILPPEMVDIVTDMATSDVSAFPFDQNCLSW